MDIDKLDLENVRDTLKCCIEEVEDKEGVKRKIKRKHRYEDYM